MAENILHYAAIRVRVKGAGNLLPTLIGLDETTARSMEQIVMSQTPGQEPTKLVNFQAQRAKLRLEVFDINEVFNISRIIVYIKQIWASYPQ